MVSDRRRRGIFLSFFVGCKFRIFCGLLVVTAAAIVVSDLSFNF